MEQSLKLKDHSNSLSDKILNKSFMTTFVSISLIILGKMSPIYSDQLYAMGLFATSGAITNWLAIHMLFEKVPFLYGSGVIPLRFEEFKTAIRDMMMNQFFTKENIDNFIKSNNSLSLDAEKISSVIDYNLFFNKLLETVAQSNLGSMLMMFGGPAALEPLREKFIINMKNGLAENISNPDVQEKLMSSLNSSEMNIQDQIEMIVEERLNQLTPKMVKEIIQEMIKNHLGWLVLWGGVFGAMLGLLFNL